MAGKRKDKKGRVLRKGESYRNDGRYMYRYTSPSQTRKYIYAKTLDELREKEQEIEKALLSGVDYTRGKITVKELVEKYVSIKRWRESTAKSNESVLKRILGDAISSKEIREVRVIDAKEYVLRLYESGLKRSTIQLSINILKPAFDIAVEDNAIVKNPFSFPLSSVLKDDANKREAISQADKKRLIDFMQGDTCSKKYVDDVIVLLGTGLRVSELYGLTESDIDFENRSISVTKQLTKLKREYRISPPKTKSGVRMVPINDEVCAALKRIIQNRPRQHTEHVIDGYTGFLFVNQYGNLKFSDNLEDTLKRTVERYNRKNEEPLPSITPHVLRHTFCTDMAHAGMDIKSLQYLMGHANSTTTLDTYSHTSFEAAKASMKRISDLKTSEQKPDTNFDTILP